MAILGFSLLLASITVSVSDLDSDWDMDMEPHVSSVIVFGDDSNIKVCRKLERAVDDGSGDGVEREYDPMVLSLSLWLCVCVCVCFVLFLNLFVGLEGKHNSIQLKFMTNSQQRECDQV